MSYNTANYEEQGGAVTVIGGELRIASGGSITAAGTQATVLADVAQATGQQASQQPTASTQILLVEDHTVAREAMENYLRAHQFEILVARSGVEAIAMARRYHPDLILMDIQMPEMDGLEAIQTLRQQEGLADTPIIALTALAMPGDRERCLAAGANVYISKPISLRHLRHTIDTTLVQHPKTRGA